jgi:integrase
LHSETPTIKLSADAEPAKRALKGGKLARKKHFQRGSLFKRGKRNKVWIARYREPVVGANGETEFVRRSEILGNVADLPTRRDAEMVLSDRLRRVNSADYHPRSCCSFRSFVQEWEPQAFPTLKYATQEHYKYVVHSHLLPVFGNVQLRLVSRESIQTFLAGKLKEGLSWRTVKHCRTVLGTILGMAEFWGYIEDNPVRKTRLPRRGLQPEKTILTPEQLSSLLERLPEPSRSLVWLLVLTGLRIGELLALRWQDVDLQAGLLRVSRTLYEGRFDEPKTRSSIRTVPLSAKGLEILTSVRPGAPKPDALVFCSKKGTPLCRRNLRNRQLDPVCEELKIPKIGWHSLRHSNATLLDAVGTPLGTVQSLLGHSSPEITRGTYIHSLPAGAKEAVQKVEDLLTGPKRTQIVEIHKMASSLIQ